MKENQTHGRASSHEFAVVQAGVLMVALWLVVLRSGAAPAAVDEDAPWPRTRTANGNSVTLHQPQVERWTSNSFAARAVVEVKPSGGKETMGVVWFEAQGKVDHVNRVVTLEQMEITNAQFPDATDRGSNALAVVRELFPGGARTVSLDYLITTLGFAQVAARQGAQGIKHTPPDIIWVTNRAVLILIDGEPVLRPMSGSSFEKVINTPALIVREPPSGKFYLAGDGQWFTAGAVKGPWSLAQLPPAEVAALTSPVLTNPPPGTYEGAPAPRIIVSTKPAELLRTDGVPDFRPVRGTSLQYAADSDSQLFYDSKNREAYLLISGRWFKADSLQGPWAYVAPRDLPSDFAKIPPGSAQAVVLASVPGTPQSELAMVANSVPTTATVSRRDAKIELTYEGEPKFKSIEGTAMSYAVNALLPVIHLGDEYYAVDNAVWFVAKSPNGPWAVAVEIPEEIYTIPPSSPVYYATFVRVYDYDDDSVETGYTAGYTGAFEDDGTVVYGTGWDYEPYYDDDYYYGWGWTWGYDYCYVPWYGWWVWRPWWSDRNGLRAAVIDNIYDRWQGRPGVTPYDRTADATARAAQRGTFEGYPALYGRFRGDNRPARWTPPATTLALNPYSRPSTPPRAGDVPKGAQLLTSLRQTPGGGRDLYASPDGNVYQRRNDAWYRRGASGKWDYYAPTQGVVQRNQTTATRNPPAGSTASGYRITPTVNSPSATDKMRRDRVPDAGSEARLQEVQALEREYYARALSTMRTQNNGSRNAGNRPSRGGGGRRR